MLIINTDKDFCLLRLDEVAAEVFKVLKQKENFYVELNFVSAQKIRKVTVLLRK